MRAELLSAVAPLSNAASHYVYRSVQPSVGHQDHAGPQAYAKRLVDIKPTSNAIQPLQRFFSDLLVPAFERGYGMPENIAQTSDELCPLHLLADSLIRSFPWL